MAGPAPERWRFSWWNVVYTDSGEVGNQTNSLLTIPQGAAVIAFANYWQLPAGENDSHHSFLARLAGAQFPLDVGHRATRGPSRSAGPVTHR
jgi:hypothetical protein